MEKIPSIRLAKFYDTEYANNEKLFGNGMPERLVMEAVKLLPIEARVVEFGAGQGRNSLAMAETGALVKAVEISQIGVDSMNKIARDKSLSTFEAVVGDARDSIEGEYDLIVSTFMLHHLTNKEAETFITDIKAHTAEGGLNLIVTFAATGDFFTALDATQENFYPVSGELQKLYADWEVIKYQEGNSRTRGTHPDGSPMFNVKFEILVRKPVEENA